MRSLILRYFRRCMHTKAGMPTVELPQVFSEALDEKVRQLEPEMSPAGFYLRMTSVPLQRLVHDMLKTISASREVQVFSEELRECRAREPYFRVKGLPVVNEVKGIADPKKRDEMQIFRSIFFPVCSFLGISDILGLATKQLAPLIEDKRKPLPFHTDSSQYAVGQVGFISLLGVLPGDAVTSFVSVQDVYNRLGESPAGLATRALLFEKYYYFPGNDTLKAGDVFSVFSRDKEGRLAARIPSSVTSKSAAHEEAVDVLRECAAELVEEGVGCGVNIAPGEVYVADNSATLHGLEWCNKMTNEGRGFSGASDALRMVLRASADARAL